MRITNKYINEFAEFLKQIESEEINIFKNVQIKKSTEGDWSEVAYSSDINFDYFLRGFLRIKPKSRIMTIQEIAKFVGQHVTNIVGIKYLICDVDVDNDNIIVYSYSIKIATNYRRGRFCKEMELANDGDKFEVDNV